MKKWDTGMGGSRTMENKEWNGPEEWKIWKSGMERSRRIENMEIGNGTVPKNEKYGNREWSSPK